MTQKELETRLFIAVQKAFELVKSQAPVRSRQLINSIELKTTSKGYVIQVNTNKAPHMVYTEEQWISEKWNGRENPNEGWFKDAVELVFRLIRAELGASGKYIGVKE